MNSNISFALREESTTLSNLNHRIRNCTSNILALHSAQEKFLKTCSPVKRTVRAKRATSRISSPLPASPMKKPPLPEVADVISRVQSNGCVLPPQDILGSPIINKSLSSDVEDILMDLKQKRLEAQVLEQVNTTLLRKSKISAFLNIRRNNFGDDVSPFSYINPFPFSDTSMLPPSASLSEQQLSRLQQTKSGAEFLCRAAENALSNATETRKTMIQTQNSLIKHSFSIHEAVGVIEKYYRLHLLRKGRKQQSTFLTQVHDDDEHDQGRVVENSILVELGRVIDQLPLFIVYEDVLACLASRLPNVYSSCVTPREIESPTEADLPDFSQVQVSSPTRTSVLSRSSTPYWIDRSCLSSSLANHPVDAELKFILEMLDATKGSRSSLPFT
ncbi:hypothetical protein RCL1_006897 [Eukaryota sp. TZLM3-RCL]